MCIKTFTRKGQKFFILEVLKGLMSQKDIVDKAFKKINPDAIALPISPEEVIGLKACVEGKVKEMAISNLEEIFSKKLEKYGEIAIPSPYLAQAFLLAKENKIKLIAIDMDEETFTDFYVKNVSTVDLIVHSQRLRFMKRKRFPQESARDFILAWDKQVNRTTGFSVVEEKREEVMAKNISKISPKRNKILVLLDVERLEGISNKLEIIFENE